jgi:hypothetical protein
MGDPELDGWGRVGRTVAGRSQSGGGSTSPRTSSIVSMASRGSTPSGGTGSPPPEASTGSDGGEVGIGRPRRQEEAAGAGSGTVPGEGGDVASPSAGMSEGSP